MGRQDEISDFLIAPDPRAPGLTRAVSGVDQAGAAVEIPVVEERPLTIYLNRQEIVTAMTIGDYPEYLALGFLRNQGMLRDDDVITGVDYDDEIETVVVRTERQTGYEDKLQKKTRTSGCAVGTVFGDMMEGLEGVTLPAVQVRTSWLYALAARINRTPSLYLEAGAIHGTVLCCEDRPLVYMEDVGRHNAVDKIAGWMLKHGVGAEDKILYTTGRLTSEMVIKTAMMGIPVLASRSGFTAWGVEIARDVGLTVIGRMRGQRFVCLAGEDRLLRDVDPASVPDEGRGHRRKSAGDDATGARVGRDGGDARGGDAPDRDGGDAAIRDGGNAAGRVGSDPSDRNGGNGGNGPDRNAGDIANSDGDGTRGGDGHA